MNSIFDRYCKRYDSWYDKNRFAYLSEIEAVRKALSRKGRGLEIGVGTGRFAFPLGIEYGVDPSRNMLKIARKRGVKARYGRGEHLPYKKGTFDYAAIIITLCFVRNAQQVLKEALRVVKRGGKVIIGIIDKDSFLGKHYRKKKSPFYTHANFFSAKQVTELLKEAGASRIAYYQTLYKLPGRIKNIQRPRKGFGKGGFVVICAQNL